MHFLLVTFEAGGNIPFEMSLVRTLASNGHVVSVLGNSTLGARTEMVGAKLFPYSQLADYDISLPRDVAELTHTLVNGFMFGEFIADDVVTLADRLSVSAVIVDSLLYAALAGAEKSGKPTASVWHTVMSDDRAPYHTENKLGRLNQIRSSIGLTPVATFREQVDAATLNLALTIEQFDAVDASLPSNFAYAGPMVEWGAPDPVWRDDSSPLVVVSFSTMHLSYQATIIQKVLDALAELNVRVLLTLGAGLKEGDLEIPTGFVTKRFVPHCEVLPHAALLITHAGYGTVVAGAMSGTPMLCLPLTLEEGAVAERVVVKGFGARLSGPETAIDQLRDEIQRLLDDSALSKRVSSFAKKLSPSQAKTRALALLEPLARI